MGNIKNLSNDQFIKWTDLWDLLDDSVRFYEEYKIKKYGNPNVKRQIKKNEEINIFSDLNRLEDKVFQLEASLKNQFERVFNKDLSMVKIHIGQYADDITNKNDADAVTIGNDIYFKSDKYSPYTEEGLQLLAHELTHVIQHNNQEKMKYVEDFQKLENEAENIESLMPTLRLHNINFPILDNTRDDEFNTDRIDDYVLNDKNNDISNINTIDDFRKKDRTSLINITLKSGKVLSLTIKQYNDLISKILIKLRNWLETSKFELTEEEYEKLILKFYKWSKNI